MLKKIVSSKKFCSNSNSYELLKNIFRHKKVEERRLMKTREEKETIYGNNFSDFLETKYHNHYHGLNGEQIITKTYLKHLNNSPDDYKFEGKLDYTVENYLDSVYSITRTEGFLKSKNFKNIVKENEDPSYFIPFYEALDHFENLSENEVVISNLPPSITEIDLYILCSTFGEIESQRLYKCMVNLPAAFRVKFKSTEDKVNFQREVNRNYIKNYLLSVKDSSSERLESPHNRVLGISNINKEASYIVYFI